MCVCVCVHVCVCTYISTYLSMLLHDLWGCCDNRQVYACTHVEEGTAVGVVLLPQETCLLGGSMFSVVGVHNQ